jgi:membrane fusion protein, copper/silver efflux system
VPLMLALFSIVFWACTSHEKHEEDTYTCPMHPTVVSDKPGSCPVCGMDLVKKSRSAASTVVPKDVKAMAQSPNHVVFSNVGVTKPFYSNRDIVVKGEGVVTYDTRFISTISSRVDGRLEFTALKYPYQSVRKGEKVAEIYSAELVTAQREWVYVTKNDPANAELIEGSRERLRLFGMTDAQIAKVLKTGDALYGFPVYSNTDGYVVPLESLAPEMNSEAQLPSQGGTMGEMSAGTATPSSAKASVAKSVLLKEGDYIRRGQSIFKIVSSSALRIELNLPASYTSWIRKGDKVHLDFSEGHQHEATIDFVQPFFEQGEQFLKVRVYTSDMTNMHIGHLVNAVIHVGSHEALWIPRSAVVDLGLDQTVFLKGEGSFKPVVVQTGIVNDDAIQILKGLTSQDEVASNGQFLVDSESFIKRD